MRKSAISLTLAGVLFALAICAAASATFAGDNQHSGLAYGQSESAAPLTWELASRTKRPRITIYRRYAYPGPNAVRQCRSWLATEYRVSGPVIVPQMRCWWE